MTLVESLKKFLAKLGGDPTGLDNNATSAEVIDAISEAYTDKEGTYTEVTPIGSEGTKIATITTNNTAHDIYVPNVTPDEFETIIIAYKTAPNNWDVISNDDRDAEECTCEYSIPISEIVSIKGYRHNDKTGVDIKDDILINGKSFDLIARGGYDDHFGRIIFVDRSSNVSRFEIAAMGGKFRKALLTMVQDSFFKGPLIIYDRLLNKKIFGYVDRHPTFNNDFTRIIFDLHFIFPRDMFEMELNTSNGGLHFANDDSYDEPITYEQLHENLKNFTLSNYIIRKSDHTEIKTTGIKEYEGTNGMLVYIIDFETYDPTNDTVIHQIYKAKCNNTAMQSHAVQFTLVS